MLSDTVSACPLAEHPSACLLPSKSESTALSHPEDPALVTQEPVVAKSPDKECDGVLASRLPAGDIIPSRERGRRGSGGSRGRRMDE